MFHVPEEYRAIHGAMKTTKSHGNNGLFIIPRKDSRGNLRAIVGDGLGWEHVSVSTQKRCPTWDEMCMVKDLFWDEDDIVVQYHPRKDEYVDCHPFCLHMWRPTEKKMPTPPTNLVGPK